MASERASPPIISVSRSSTEPRQSDEDYKQDKSNLGDDTVKRSRRSKRRPKPAPNISSSSAHKTPYQQHRAHWQFSGKTSAHGATWRRTAPENADPSWKIEWGAHCFQHGRVLIIDYISTDRVRQNSSDSSHSSDTANHHSSTKRHIRIQAQEFQSLPELQRFYHHASSCGTGSSSPAALRVIHVQNAPWATSFLTQKFNISHPSEMIGMKSFGAWVQYEKPRQRHGKPFPSGRTWRAQTDPWRNVSRTAFGMDYFKTYKAKVGRRGARGSAASDGLDRSVEAKMMHLNAYEDSRSPQGYDAAVQRVAVYVQRNLGPPSLHLSPDVDIRNPYLKIKGEAKGQFKEGEESRNHENDDRAHEGDDEHENDDEGILRAFDNGSTVIVFESSSSRTLDDCLVPPRASLENRWRRLSFYLRREDVSHDARLAANCTNIILTDIFHGLRESWDYFLACAAAHVALLEEKILENPADESRAPELWTNQAAWGKVDRVAWLHTDLVREVQGQMRELQDIDGGSGDDDDGEEEEAVSKPEDNGGRKMDIDWLMNTPSEFDRLTHNVNEDLIQPTSNLSDLMYKSVGIRDSRQSLQLGLSMWRLSWITFIFLPLLVVISFFGANVDTFENFPSVGWLILSAAILMVLVLILWYAVKHSLERSRQTPYERGLYESLFNRLEDTYPDLWTRAGAADDVAPTSFADRLRWRLIKRWFAPEKTINRKLYSSLAPDSDTTELGAWDSFKRTLLLRWLPRLKADILDDSLALAETGSAGEDSTAAAASYQATTLQALAQMSTPIAVAEAEPAATSAPFATYGLRPLNLRTRLVSNNSSPRNSEDRPGSRGSSGMMVEERNFSDSESDVGEGSSGATATDLLADNEPS